MNRITMKGQPLPDMPWQPKPEGSTEVIWRHTENPITGWNVTPKCARIFNSAVIPYNGKYIGVFRADHRNGMPQLHVGRSDDGYKWEVNDDEIHWKDEQGKDWQSKFAYDPRLVRLDDTHYIMWCTDFSGPTIGLGRTQDFEGFTRLENVYIPFNRNGVLFPRKVNDEYLMLSRPSDNGHTPFGDIFISASKDLVYWGKHRKVMCATGDSWWQSVKIGAGPIPIETSEGWLMFYHGVYGSCSGFIYSIGVALLDLETPSKVLYRTEDYILTPEEEYETVGFVPNVAFPCASLHDPDSGRIALYYGAADTYTAIAYTQVEELVQHLKSNSRLFPGDGEEYR